MKALQRLAGAATSVAALTVLLGLVAGVPVMLIVGFGWPLPRSLPSWGQITMWFQTQGMDDSVLLRVLAVVLWIAWAYLLAGLVVQAVGVLRGGRARRHRWAVPSQRVAGLLVGLMMLGVALMTRPTVGQAPTTPLRSALSAPRASAADPLPTPADAALTRLNSPVTASAGEASLTASSPAPGDVEVEVLPGDSLWTIAGREYGDPNDWPEIWEANEGQTEDDGRVFTDPSLIHPGWELLVPDVPAAPAGPSGSGAAGEPGVSPSTTGSASSSPDATPQPTATGDVEVEVQPGDSLWTIAAEEYGDPYQWPRIWDANEGQTEDNGYTFSDPSLIDPGWELLVPVDAPPATSTPTPGSAVPPVTGPPTAATPTPAVSPEAPPTAAPAAVPSPTAAGAPVHASVPSHATSQAWAVPLAEGGALAGLTAAALAGLLLAAQRYERWRRRPGRVHRSRIALLARRPSMRRIRAALATARASSESGEGLATPGSPAALESALQAVEAVPGRIVVGRIGEDGGDAVVDIDQLHRLVLSGPGARSAARAMVVAFLAHHPWAQALVAQAPGNSLLTAPEETPGLQCLAAAALLDRLEGEIRYQRGILERDHLVEWRQRAGGPDPLPAVLTVFEADAVASGDVERLGAAVEAAGGLAIAVVVVGELNGARWGDVVDVDGAGGIDAISAAVLSGARSLYSLSLSQAAELLTVVACGRGPDIVPDLTDEEEDLALVPDTDAEAHGGPSAPEPVGQPAGPAPVLTIPPALELRLLDLRIYGRVRVLVDGRETLTAMPDAGRQVLALLAVRGELTEKEAVHALGAGSADQVWRSRFVRGTRGTRPALREALGDPSVDPIPCVGGVFRLNPDVLSSDYRRLVTGRHAASQTSNREHRLALLARATQDVRGEPFADADYNWLVEHQEHVRSLAIDTLSTVAELYADLGDLDAAIEALDQALSIDPDPVERLFQKQIVWQHRLGRKEAARDLYRRLTHELSERCDREPSEETESLMESLDATPRVVVR
jgi:nucleoid-associated protein YgaU